MNEIKIEQQKQFDFFIMSTYHKNWVQKIKKQTGAVHCAHVRAPKEYFIHTHFRNELGGTDIIKYKLEVGHPNELREKDYTDLIDALNTREGVKTQKNSQINP